MPLPIAPRPVFARLPVWRHGTALSLVLAASGMMAVQADGTTETQQIVVVGHRDPEGLLPRQTAAKEVSSIAADFIAKQAPTLNAYQLVDLLPGANVASSDPYGLSVSSSLTLRGLTQDEIGVLMEGAPQNDIGYYDAYPSQFADAENVKTVTLEQGSVDIDSPIVNGSGGLLSLSLDNPKAHPQALVELSAGSYAERRGFVRYDTGAIGNTGLMAFVSYSRNHADNWRGAGYDTRQHVDAKLLKNWGDESHASLAVSYNDADTSTYPSPSLAQWRQYGRNFNYDASYGSGDINDWRLYRSPFRNEYVSAPVHVKFNDLVSFDNTTYLQYGYGNSPYGTTLSTGTNYLGTEAVQINHLPGAQNGTAIVLGNFTGNQFRAGDVAKLIWHLGRHTITTGLWADYGTDHDVESFTPVSANGTPADIWGYSADAIRTATGAIYEAMDVRTTTVAKGFFVADGYAITPRLVVEAGFKGVDLTHDGWNGLPGPQGTVRTDNFAPLPRAAIHYDLDRKDQLYADVTTNFRAPDEYTLYNGYYDGALTSQGVTSLRNEYSVSEEIGYRYTGPDFSGSVTGFHYNFRNRQLATVEYVNGAQVDTTINAGRQTSNGIDAEVDWRPMEGLSFYSSGELLRATIDDNLPVDGDYLPTKGKSAVEAPPAQFGLGGTYDNQLLFGSFALKYVGRQYSTFMNDESIPGYSTLDLAVGIHLAGLLDGKRTDLRLNVINATDPHVLSGVQSISTNAQNTIGKDGTLIQGTAPTYYIGAGRAVVATLARQF